ncbi:MAG: hypothetical protein WA985_06225 [Erythrobacter sp.]|uniref:hypothetical protein n=1 Tax=Erythrobacter sp. TaxID=1042 RepID=UPI003C73E156
MNTKAILLVAGLAVLIGSLFIDTRLAPFIGAALLLGAIIYGWASNRKASDENLRKAERATHEQREEHYHDKRP